MKNSCFHMVQRLMNVFVIFAFFTSLVIFPETTQAQNVLNLPQPGAMIKMSPAYDPTLIMGMTVHPDDPLLFDFIVHPGDSGFQGTEFQKESNKLIKYFLAALTVPENEMWVNLSPYEKDRIIPDGFGDTEMGRDLLAQDYMLKQLTASLMYPEEELGNDFWNRVYKRTQEKYGTSQVPINTFNKVWIVPESAVIHESGRSVFVLESHLKVMLEEDYLALESNDGSTKHGLGDVTQDDLTQISEVSSKIIREIIIPEIEKEVNEGKTFANLRQISNSVILATWYKEKIQGSILEKVYIDRNKTKGVDTQDKEINQKIYKQYVEAFKRGAYDYMKENYDPVTQEVISKKYFSGGALEKWSGTFRNEQANESYRERLRGAQEVTTRLGNANSPVGDTAMLTDETEKLFSALPEISAEQRLPIVVGTDWSSDEVSHVMGVLNWITVNFPDEVSSLKSGLGEKSIYLTKGKMLREAYEKIAKAVSTQLSRSGMDAMSVNIGNSLEDLRRHILLEDSLLEPNKVVLLMIAMIHELLGVQPEFTKIIEERIQTIHTQRDAQIEYSAFQVTVSSIGFLLRDEDLEKSAPSIFESLRRQLPEERKNLQSWERVPGIVASEVTTGNIEVVLPFEPIIEGLDQLSTEVVLAKNLVEAGFLLFEVGQKQLEPALALLQIAGDTREAIINLRGKVYVITLSSSVLGEGWGLESITSEGKRENYSDGRLRVFDTFSEDVPLQDMNLVEEKFISGVTVTLYPERDRIKVGGLEYRTRDDFGESVPAALRMQIRSALRNPKSPLSEQEKEFLRATAIEFALAGRSRHAAEDYQDILKGIEKADVVNKPLEHQFTLEQYPLKI